MKLKKNSFSGFGVVEAYYGKAWSAADRLACLRKFPQLSLGNYLYAPKADKYLRSQWQIPWPQAVFDQLCTIFDTARAVGLNAGVGLSPLGLGDLNDSDNRAQLRAKLEQINLLKGNWLGVFFDDMPSAGKSMAAAQLEIIEFIAASSNADKLIVCPSYYTTDSLLEKIFGEMPANYWRELGRNLPAEIAFFWTGEKVCSRSYNKDNLEFIADNLKRLPTLWDNYPVNDGEKSSRYLNLKPFAERAAWLGEYTEGHFANPMLQPNLSLLPLATLASSYGADAEELQRCWETAGGKLCPDLYRQIWGDSDVFQYEGLDALENTNLIRSLEKYRSSSSPFAQEVIDWLDGVYRFDPACLTG